MMVESNTEDCYGECPIGFESSLWHKCKACECKDYHLLSVSSLLKDKHPIEDVIRCLDLSGKDIFEHYATSQEFCKYHVALSKWQELKALTAVWGFLLPCLAKLQSIVLLQSIERLLRQPEESWFVEAQPERSLSNTHDHQANTFVISIEERSKNYERLIRGQVSPNYVRDCSPPSVEKTVKTDMNSLQRSFASLLRKTFKACLEKGTTLPDVRIFLTQRCADEKESILLFESNMIEIINHTTLEQTFLFMSRIGAWDFLNFRLVFEITEEFGLEEVHNEMQSYKGRVNEFKKNTRLADFLHFWDGRSKEDSLPDCKAVIAKLRKDFPTTTLADVSRTEKDLTGQFKLKQYVLRLANGDSGSVYIMWLVPLSAAMEMLRQMESSTPPNLAELGIEELVIGRKIFKTALSPQPLMRGFWQIHKDSVTDADAFWSAQAKGYLEWKKIFDKVDASNMNEGIVRWFPEGMLNVSVNCLDRHVKTQPDAVAIIWEKDEPMQHENITYRVLLEMTCKVANVLKDKGVTKGDRVIIYMPAMPLAAASMLACARIGAVHCALYSSLNSKALGKRISDTGAKVIITADVRVHGGKESPLKANVDQALSSTTHHNVKHVLVTRRTKTTKADVNLCSHPRDVDLDQEMKQQPGICEPVFMNGDDDLFVTYTSGTTGASGEPKGIIHSQAGYLLYAAFTHKFIFDHKPGDVFGCMADLGWIPSHTFVVYGPLCNGGTAVLFESTATYPNSWRYWEMIERLKITQFYITPYVVKSIMVEQARSGDKGKRTYDRSSLRIIAVAGEPLHRFVLDWYQSHLGTPKCTVLDTWWQTETGSVAFVTWYPPKDETQKPPAHYPSDKRTFPFFGVEPVLLNKEGSKGRLCLKRTIPGMGKGFQSPHVDPVKLFKEAYFTEHPGYYYTYDLADEDSMSRISIVGRVDDAVRIKGVWANVPHIESVMKLNDDRIHETLLVEYQCTRSHDEASKAATCAFIGVEDKLLDQEEERQVILSQMKQRLSEEKLPPPQKFIFTDSQYLPKTLTGKSIRPALKHIAQDEFCNNNDSHCVELKGEKMKEYSKRYGHDHSNKLVDACH